MIGVYGIRHVPSQRTYVGSSIDIFRRFKAHQSNLRNGTHRNSHLQRSWIKYGEVSFEFIVLEECSREMVIVCEQKWIDLLQACIPEKGFNACPVAASVGSLPKSSEHRAKIGAALKGSKRSPEARQRISKAMSGKMRGPLSPEVRAKISAAKRGKPMSEQAKKKLSISRTGVKTGPCSDTRRAAISVAKRARDADKLRFLK